ncbi:ABC transporter substrate-binding protein [Halocatena salina]|uniref:ABC transporter substrate-binding protein n=1 Tax=Halocatena salina TaxID=2934340 RepID=A0A8U0A6P2_9EURY|nr:ABC transporter substrate-binding protein [Halocatena salina]UPM43623.1 ABC transporter substrate-binding protein [Halocatena salina]
MTDSEGLSRRGFLQATGGAAAAMSLAGCIGGDDGGDNGGSQTPQKGGRLNFVNSTMDGFDPVASDGTASGRIITQVFDPLVHYPAGTVEVESLLAENYETSDDNTVYTFTLKDATFHNGDPVTAKDVVYSFERVAGSPHSVRSDFILSSIGVTHETDSDGNYEPGTLGVKAVDEKTVEVTLEQPFHSTLEVLAYAAFAIVPQGIVGSLEEEGTSDEPSDQYTEFTETNPIGAGPFKFDHWNKQEEAEVVRYEDYHGQTAYVDGVHWAVIEDDSAMLNYAMEGNADIFNIPTSEFDPGGVSVDNTDDKKRETGTYKHTNGEEFDYLKVPEVATRYIAFNVSNVPKPVRQAIAYLFNTESYVKQVYKNRRIPAYHLTPSLVYPGGPDAADTHVQENYPYSPGKNDAEGAKKVMEEAGYGENNRYQLDFTHYQSKEFSDLAKNLQQRAGQAYIDISAQAADFQTLQQRGENGTNELYSLGWIADWPRPDNFLKLLYPPNTHTGDPAAYTYLDWGRDSTTEASEKAANAFEKIQNNLGPSDKERKTREEAYIQMEEANWEDAVLIPTNAIATEYFSYQNVHIEDKFGGMGVSRSMYNTIWKEQE